MKQLRLLILLSLISASSLAHSFELMDSIKKYALPCGASLLAGGLIAPATGFSGNQGAGLGLLGCSVVIISNETVPKNQGLSLEQEESIAKILDNNRKVMHRDFDDKITALIESTNQESIKNREVVKNVIGNVAVVMEEDIMKRVQDRLSKMEGIKGLRDEMKASLKLEIVAELRERRQEIEDSVIQKVIDRIVLEKVRVEKDESGKTKRSN